MADSLAGFVGTSARACGSLWVVPPPGAVIGLVGAVVAVPIDQEVNVPAQWQYSPSMASTVLSASDPAGDLPQLLIQGP